MSGQKYAEILEELQHVIITKQDDIFENGIFLIHDSATPLTLRVALVAVLELGITQLGHSPQSTTS